MCANQLTAESTEAVLKQNPKESHWNKYLIPRDHQKGGAEAESDGEAETDSELEDSEARSPSATAEPKPAAGRVAPVQGAKRKAEAQTQTQSEVEARKRLRLTPSGGVAAAPACGAGAGAGVSTNNLTKAVDLHLLTPFEGGHTGYLLSSDAITAADRLRLLQPRTLPPSAYMMPPSTCWYVPPLLCFASFVGIYDFFVANRRAVCPPPHARPAV